MVWNCLSYLSQACKGRDEVGVMGAGSCPVGGMAWLGIAWWMNWSNNLANSVEAVGVIVGVTLVCCCSGEVTVGIGFVVLLPLPRVL